MAKKKQAKRAKGTKRKAADPLVEMVPEYSTTIHLTRQLLKEPETVRRLAHRVVDILADSGRHAWLADTVASDLVCFADDVIVSSVSDLIREARAPGKEASRG